MTRKKRKIIVVVEPLSEEGKTEFQKKVNEVYCDVVNVKLRQSNLAIDEKNHVLDTLHCMFATGH